MSGTKNFSWMDVAVAATNSGASGFPGAIAATTRVSADH